jgi:hypothetical protein
LQCEKGVLVFCTTACDLRETSYFLKLAGLRDQLISLVKFQPSSLTKLQKKKEKTKKKTREFHQNFSPSLHKITDRGLPRTTLEQQEVWHDLALDALM